MTRAFVTLAFLTGCVNEYHPEYHPVSIVSVQATSRERAPLREYRAPDPDYSKMFSHQHAEDPFEVAAPVPAATLAVPPPPTLLPETKPHRGGVYIGDGVRINGNVTINGDVYITTRR